MDRNEAIKIIKDNWPESRHQFKEALEFLIPELKESEDERIRKDIIKYLEQSQFGEEHYLIDDDVVRGYIAWLEKQGEQKQHLELKAGHWYFCHQAYCCRADHLTVKEGERFMCEKDGVVKGFLIKEPEKYFREVCPPAPMEDEQKPTDKVEPKFKVGDWVVYNDNLYHIGNIALQRYYECLRVDGTVHTFGLGIDSKSHLWTIQDAKDGDVLANENMVLIFKCFEEPSYRQHIIAHIGLDICGRIQVTNGCWKLGLNGAKLATKEQRDLLFQKMKEAGYEWDAEKKELKKIERNPAWSEKDEKMLDAIIGDIQFTQKVHTREVEQVVYERKIDWLKSLRERMKGE